MTIAALLGSASALASGHGADSIPSEGILRLSLEQCIDSAMAGNPRVGAAALQAQKARILRGTAFDPPKTEVTLKQETTGGGGPENGVYFGQEFEFPTLYAVRHRHLSAIAGLEESRFALEAAEVEKEVSLVYQELVYLSRLIELNASLGEVYGEFCRVARVRLEEGEGGALEVMNAERVMEGCMMERSELLTRYEASLRELRRLTCCRGPFDIEKVALEPAARGADFISDFDSSMRGIESGRSVEVAEREIAVAKNEFLPGIRLGATVQALIKGFNPYHVERERFRQGNFMGFEVGVTVPLFFGASSSRLKAARAERQIALLNRQTAEAEWSAEAGRLEGELAVFEQRIEYYVATAVPRADEIRRIAKVSYELGEIDYMEYIQNVETAFGVYREYAECVNEYNRRVAESRALKR